MDAVQMYCIFPQVSREITIYRSYIFPITIYRKIPVFDKAQLIIEKQVNRRSLLDKGAFAKPGADRKSSYIESVYS